MGILMQNDSFVGGIDSSLVNKIGTAPLDTVAQDLSSAVNELKATGGGGNVDDVYVNGVSVLDSNKIAQIDLTPYVNKSGDTMTGNLSLSGTDINLKTSGSSSNDSGDIVWYYGNGQEKAKLWTDDAYTAESGLNFRMYKEDGTQLFSGTIPLRDTNTTYNFSGTTFYSGNSNTAEHNCDNAINNGNYYYTSNGPATSIGASTSDGALYVQSYSDIWVAQIAQDYRNGRLFVRGKKNGTWQSWNKVANSSDLDSYVAKSGDTMTGQLKTSFKESVAMGSYQATATTIPDLANELRFSSGCCGSFNLSTAYTLNGYTIPKGWYNFFYAPHRSGGNSGAAVGDNCSYGALILFGMTVNGAWRLRYANGIQTLNPFGTGDGKYKSIWNSGVGIGIATNPNDSTSIGIGVSNAATFRSSIGAQAALSSSVGALSVTYNSTNAVTNNDMWYAKYGNVVQLCGSVKNKKAITIPSHGDLGDLHMFTLPSGYHPKITVGGIADNGNLVSWRIAPDGKVYLTAVYRSTGTWAAGAVFAIRATFIV